MSIVLGGVSSESRCLTTITMKQGETAVIIGGVKGQDTHFRGVVVLKVAGARVVSLGGPSEHGRVGMFLSSTFTVRPANFVLTEKE